MFLLDTDTIIYNLKGNEAIKKNLQYHFDTPLKISVITLMELYYGAYKSEIASCALAYNLTLVTNNLKHFSRIEGLKITNWSVYPEKHA